MGCSPPDSSVHGILQMDIINYIIFTSGIYCNNASSKIVSGNDTGNVVRNYLLNKRQIPKSLIDFNDRKRRLNIGASDCKWIDLCDGGQRYLKNVLMRFPMVTQKIERWRQRNFLSHHGEFHEYIFEHIKLFLPVGHAIRCMKVKFFHELNP